MDWKKVGFDEPVEDERGGRPETDEDGAARATEFIAYEPLKHLDFRVDEKATARDRRQLVAIIDRLMVNRISSVAYAADFESSLSHVLTTFVRGVKTETEEHSGTDAATFLDNELDYGDAVVLMQWILRRVTLSDAKKKR